MIICITHNQNVFILLIHIYLRNLELFHSKNYSLLLENSIVRENYSIYLSIAFKQN